MLHGRAAAREAADRPPGRASAARRMAQIGRREAGPPGRTARRPGPTSIGRPPSVSAPSARGAPQQRRVGRVVDEVVDERGRRAAVERDRRRRRRAAPCRPAWRSRARPRRRPAAAMARRVTPTAAASRRAASSRRAWTVTAAPAAPTSPRPRCAPHRRRRESATRRPRRSRPASGAMNAERRRVLPASQPSAVRRSVLTAPTVAVRASTPVAAAQRVELERRGHRHARDAEGRGERLEVGEVRRRQRQVDGVEAGGGERGVVHRRRQRVARPAGRARRRSACVGPIACTRNSSRMRASDNCPGATASPA